MPERTTGHLNPRAPLVLDTKDLPRRPGSMRAVQRTVPAPVELGLPLIKVPEGRPVELDLRMESVSEGVLVSGTVTAPLEGECGRCLRPITDTRTEAIIQELYAYPDSTTDETADADEISRLDGDLADLEPAIRDAIVLGLPANPVCREDCPGLCPDCGESLADLPADHGHERIDPRWAALGRLVTDRTEPPDRS